MYTRASKVEMNKKVLTSFCDPKGRLRIVLATTAFGMGVDCADVRVIYFWGHQQVLKSTCKNQGELVEMVCHQKPYCYNGKPGKYVKEDVKEYGQNTTKCRRNLLLKNFMFNDSSDREHCGTCCDICKTS